MNKGLSIKIIIFSIIFGIFILRLIYLFIYYLLVFSKINKFNINIREITDLNLFFSSDEIYNKIKHINSVAELDSLLQQCREKRANPFGLERIVLDDYEIDNFTCIICYDEENNLINDVVKLKCNHKYHLECINKWLKIKNVCPLCKENILYI